MWYDKNRQKLLYDNHFIDLFAAEQKMIMIEQERGFKWND